MDTKNNFAQIKQGSIRLCTHVDGKAGIFPKLRVQGDEGFIDMVVCNTDITLTNLGERVKEFYRTWEKEIIATINCMCPSNPQYDFQEYGENELREMLGIEDFLLEK